MKYLICGAGSYLLGQRFTLAHTSYADYLKFIKNKSRKNSSN